ncbi:MAG: hypothetical protein AAF085_05425 [Planctomycetota bacterium]
MKATGLSAHTLASSKSTKPTIPPLRLVGTEHSDKLPDLSLSEFEECLPGYKARHEAIAHLIRLLGKKNKASIESYVRLFQTVDSSSMSHNLITVCKALSTQSPQYVHAFAYGLHRKLGE